MEAVVLHGISELKYEQVPVPALRPGTVRVQLGFCGVCGSDIPRTFSKGTYSFPTICGHEFAGTVAAVAEGVSDYAVGDRVTVFPLLWNDDHPACEEGEYAQSDGYDYLGSRSDGGFAGWMIIIPQSPAQIIRCIYESLALSYSEAWAKLERFSPVELTRLNIVGGGCQDALLNQLTADAIGKPVWVGPVEATGVGNIISQMISNAEVASLSAGRQLIAKSFPCECIDPVDTFLWDDARSRFRSMVSGH